MKIILSRKGFDSGYGGCASPIFPDQSMASFPIPEVVSRHKMSQLSCGKHNLSVVARNLVPASAEHPLSSAQTIHLDPYLRCVAENPPIGWTSAFGQDGTAQSHLGKQKVGPGDLFLFFGWFRRVEQINGRGPWTFVPNTPDLHVIFGWLQVGEVLKVSEYQNHIWRTKYQWLKDHPHIRHANRYPKNNTIYVASRQLVIDGQRMGRPGKKIPGGGTFGKFSSLLQLTHPDQPNRPLRRSIWQLPHWFSSFDTTGKHALTYHGNAKRWRDEPRHQTTVELHSVAKGQEFVLNLDGVPKIDANKWLEKLFAKKSLEG